MTLPGGVILRESRGRGAGVDFANPNGAVLPTSKRMSAMEPKSPPDEATPNPSEPNKPTKQTENSAKTRSRYTDEELEAMGFRLALRGKTFL